MKINNSPIGIFDSGIGGLTVLKEVRSILPAEDIIYLGDTARVPYGVRSPETVERYSFECTDFLLKKNIKLLVVACNTVSAISLKAIQKKLSIPVIGVIEPGARAAVRSTKNRIIGIIGTQATVRSGAYIEAIKALDGGIEVHALACPLFVPLVEEGWTDGIIAGLIAEKYLINLKDKQADTVVLGCTHYPLLKHVIQEVMGPVKLIDSAVETALAVRDMLHETDMTRTEDAASDIEFFVTDSPDRFIGVGESFLQSRIENIKKIKL